MKHRLLPHLVLVMSLGYGSLGVAQTSLAPAVPTPRNPFSIAAARALEAVTIEPRGPSFGLAEIRPSRTGGFRSVMQSSPNGVGGRGKSWKRIVAGIAVAGAGAYFVNSARPDTIAISAPRYCVTFEPLLGRTLTSVCGRDEYRQPVEGSEQRKKTLGWATVGAGAALTVSGFF
jgi:hypothetical protein